MTTQDQPEDRLEEVELTVEQHISSLRDAVAQYSARDRERGRAMGEAGDLNEGYIVSLIESVEVLLAEYDATSD